MNKQRRKMIEDVKTRLDELKSSIEMILEEEREAYDNMPESLQESERGQAMDDAIYALDSALEACDEVKEHLDEAQQ